MKPISVYNDTIFQKTGEQFRLFASFLHILVSKSNHHNIRVRTNSFIFV